MPGRRGSANPEIYVDFIGFSSLFRRTKEFDKKLATSIRRRIRIPGKEIVADIQRQVRSGTYQHEVGLREGIAQGVRLNISTGQNRPGIRIVASGRALPAEKKPLVAAWQSKKGWRHPVFGNLNIWVHQDGRPFFYNTIAKGQPKLGAAIRDAAREAADYLGDS